ncbi:MAG: hydantoinase/oxoprolinase family protein [Anaerolineaceae bacterium]|nr:hydantoinase/oxoprolinase family protein [Anaerolineaceae bacterium]MCY3935656.1 hydantoinase/oxoprolinase family protein [Chloroflexota bacterium]
MRIGIDVGGTNTDIVLMEGREVRAWYKTPTTADVTAGIINSLQHIIDEVSLDPASLDGVMIGTTHFTNAVVERRHLQETACLRLGLPATVCLPPMVDWPDDLRDVVGNHYFLAHGGHEFDGRVISPFDESEIRGIAEQIRDRGISAVAISSVFSPVNTEFEVRAGEIVADVIPDANVTLSSEIGRIGLLERENAAIMNGCLRTLALRTIAGFRAALEQMAIEAPFFISQNDGTLMNAEFAADYPVLTFASGPTNSMRGAAFLSGLRDAIVVDVGGTTTDIGVLQQGFPRVAALAVDIGGVRTNFRMPDTYNIGLGGGSLVQSEPIAVGPRSVGYEITDRALIFGGEEMTASDVMVATGKVDIGDRSRVTQITADFAQSVEGHMLEMVTNAVDRMKTSATPVPVIVVGGGSILLQEEIPGASEMLKPPHFAVANAIGAAIAQVGGECDRIFSLEGSTRDEVLDQAKDEARQRAIAAGATSDSIEIVDVEEVPLAYLPGNAIRIAVKAVGDLEGA